MLEYSDIAGDGWSCFASSSDGLWQDTSVTKMQSTQYTADTLEFVPIFLIFQDVETFVVILHIQYAA